MHLLKYLSVTLAIATFVLLAVGSGEATARRKTWFAAAAVCLVTTVSLVAGLLHAQRPICTTLGGEWIAEEHACRDEFGGNGNNDPDNGLTFSD